MYERERLRFYYAIVECDSAVTAASLYKQCDGLVRAPAAARQAMLSAALTARAPCAPARVQEFERSSTRLDLRYVPDEQTFAGREPRDVALSVSARAACRAPEWCIQSC